MTTCAFGGSKAEALAVSGFAQGSDLTLPFVDFILFRDNMFTS